MRLNSNNLASVGDAPRVSISFRSNYHYELISAWSKQSNQCMSSLCSTLVEKGLSTYVEDLGIPLEFISTFNKEYLQLSEK